jgi:nucleotide-binding universal stress UspA family protein
MEGYMSYQQILVPLDGSKLAEKALDYLPHIAAPGAHVHLLSVIADSYAPSIITNQTSPDLVVEHFGTTFYPLQTRDLCVDYLQALAYHLTSSGYLVSIDATDGDVVDTILTVANSRYDAILMTTHGRTGLSKLVMGSITETVLRRALCPVVVVPVHPEHIQRFPHKKDKTPRVLICLDGTPESETILPEVEKLLGKRPARIVLLRVVQTYDIPLENIESRARHLRWVEVHDDPNRTLGSTGELAMCGYLHHIATRFDYTNELVRCEIGDNHPAEEILFYADLYRVDLIAMATHGRTGLPRLIHGSVTESVLDHAPCPMLISHPYQRDPVLADTMPASLTSR